MLMTLSASSLTHWPTVAFAFANPTTFAINPSAADAEAKIAVVLDDVERVASRRARRRFRRGGRSVHRNALDERFIDERFDVSCAAIGVRGRRYDEVPVFEGQRATRKRRALRRLVLVALTVVGVVRASRLAVRVERDDDGQWVTLHRCRASPSSVLSHENSTTSKEHRNVAELDGDVERLRSDVSRARSFFVPNASRKVHRDGFRALLQHWLH